MRTGPTTLRLLVLLGAVLAVGPLLGWGLVPSLALAAAVALVAHERRVVSDWRQAPVRLTTPR